MKKVFTILGVLTLIIVAIVLSIIAYWSRPQNFDFALLMPNEMEYCGQIIDEGNAKYKELKRWFSVSQESWENTPVTYVPRYEFSSNTMTVNILNSSVVVNYQSSEKEWNQVVRVSTSGPQFEECPEPKL